jgi:hypothetical protein
MAFMNAIESLPPPAVVLARINSCRQELQQLKRLLRASRAAAAAAEARQRRERLPAMRKGGARNGQR